MNRFCIALLVGALLVPGALFAQTETGTTGKVATPLVMPGDPKVSVDFKLVMAMESCEVVVTITNRWHEALTLEHPGNRYALAFLVMNELGNAVAPTGFAKVSMVRHEDVLLKPGETFERTARWSGDKYLFQFVTGSALFGYELEFGKTYRVVAVYRPDGKDGEGVCSKEKVITIAAHAHSKANTGERTRIHEPE